MEGHRTVVLLPPTEALEKAQIAEIICKAIDGAKETLILSQGLCSVEELKGFNREIRFPEEFFNRKRSDWIDSNALELARSWYRPLGEATVFNGVNLAQMCEYSFYFVFVDCLRSLDIAKRLLDEAGIESLILPQTKLTPEISEICYESLPNALEFIALRKGIATERINLPAIDDSGNAEISKSSRPWGKSYSYERLLEILALVLRENAVFFHNVYAYESLARETKKLHLRPLRIIPYRRSSAKTVALMNDLRSHSAKWIRTVMDNIDLGDDSGAALSIASERLSEFFLKTAPALAEYVEWANHFSRKMRPSVLVSMEDITPVNRCISRVLHESNTQIVILQHGLLTKDMAGYYLMPIEGSVQAVWGEYSSDWHTARGKDPSTLVITGCPNYENIKPQEESLAVVRERIGVEANRPILLIGTSRYSGISAVFTLEKEQRFFDNVYCGLSGRDEYQVVTKMHPSCGKAYFEMAKRAAARWDVKTTLTKGNLRELLALAQAVAIPTSTIGYEAVLMRKPLVCVDFEEQRGESVFVSANVAIGVERANELVSGIATAIELTQSNEYEKSRDRFIKHHLDGKDASSGIAGLIRERHRLFKVERKTEKQSKYRGP